MREIITKYQNNIKKIIKNFTGSENEDIEQEVYVKTWKNMSKYEERNKFKQWISAITSNTCKDYLKKNKVYIENSEEILDNLKDEKNFENNIESKERQKRILKEINRLPLKLREVIIYYELENKSYEEIAIILNKPTGTVKSRLYSAREILRGKLKDLM